MTIDDQLMAVVWADPDCPVELADPDAFAAHGPIPWPRERIEVPDDNKGDEVYYHLCRRHGQGRPGNKFMLTIVAMPWRVWVVNRPGEPSAVRVYLGQCEDCGRIYWATVR
jgi:hypothetical protein